MIMRKQKSFRNRQRTENPRPLWGGVLQRGK